MISFFRTYSLFKFILAGLILVIVRIVAMKTGIPLLVPELTWQLAGERMSNGYSLYKDIWTNIEPLSGFTYYIIDVLFGRSQTAYQVIALILTLFQALIFNLGLNENKIYAERTSMPAILYVLFSFIFFDFYTLSPALLGTTFLIIVFDLVCTQSKNEKHDGLFFYVGLLTGIASLFYLPFLLFLPCVVLSLGLFSSTNLRKHMVVVLAFFFPYLLLFIYYFWIDNLVAFYTFTIQSVFTLSVKLYISLLTLLKISIVPALLLLLSFATIAARGKYIHYQYKIIKVMGVWLFFSLLTLLVTGEISGYSIYIFVPVLSFFCSHLFLLTRHIVFREIIFWGTFAGIFVISFYALKKPDSYSATHLISAPPTELIALGIEGKNVAVLGSNTNYYYGNHLACPYLNWELSKVQFSRPDNYQDIADIFETFEKNKPDYIMNMDGLTENIFKRMPALEAEYSLVENSNFVYKRNEPKNKP